jgi:hypothetical protein
VEVRHDEGIAIRIDPEPCADARKGGSEASVGERIGQQLSLAKIRILGADAWTDASARASGQPGVVEEPACAEASSAGTGRSHV